MTASAIKAKITEDMKTAMREQAKERLATIRLILAAAKQREVDERIELSDEQKQQIEGLRAAPMVGVSHLVRLIAARGLPTWGIEALPKAVQKFHAFDSQIVSRLFGGGRKVNLTDIRVMFLPASMRSQIIA